MIFFQEYHSNFLLWVFREWPIDFFKNSFRYFQRISTKYFIANFFYNLLKIYLLKILQWSLKVFLLKICRDSCRDFLIPLGIFISIYCYEISLMNAICLCCSFVWKSEQERITNTSVWPMKTVKVFKDTAHLLPIDTSFSFIG